MGEPVIVTRDVGKRYQLGELEQYRALRDTISSAARRLTRRRGPGRADVDHIWALSHVSFDVDAGEVVGLIGRNGAGKSTMLRLLSRITAPTTGEIAVKGRIGSLLEVGTGFHPELTGRENVFLNGAILGMRRTEISSKLDDIVEFAEMEQFISTPVKHYSVGMYMRLAFSVAAHLDAEILVVDEVLAVGDSRFQQKCLGKIGDVARSGRTVLFVSHNLGATAALCDRCVLFEEGRLVEIGGPADVIDRYLGLNEVRARPHQRIDLSAAPRVGTGGARFVSATFRSAVPRHDRSICSGDGLVIELEVESGADRAVQSLGVTVNADTGVMLVNVDSAALGSSIQLRRGLNRLRVDVAQLPLGPGRYSVGLRLADPVTSRIGSGAVDMIETAFFLEIEQRRDSRVTGGLVAVTFEIDSPPAEDQPIVPSLWMTER